MQTLWPVPENLQKIPQIAVSAIDRFVIIKMYEVHGDGPAALPFGTGRCGLRRPGCVAPLSCKI